MVVDPMNLNQLILAEGNKKLNNNTSKPKLKNYKPFSTSKVLAESAVFISLSTALSLIIIYTLPQGGSITLASMVPLIWLALRRGPIVGITAGVLYGGIQFILLPYAYNPIQVLLDYPLAFGCIGLAGFFRKQPLVGTVIAVSGRFVMHFISGFAYFGPMFAPDINPYVYSAIYNGSYLIPEMAISVFAIFLLQKSKVLRAYL